MDYHKKKNNWMCFLSSLVLKPMISFPEMLQVLVISFHCSWGCDSVVGTYLIGGKSPKTKHMNCQKLVETNPNPAGVDSPPLKIVKKSRER